jgi:hypothetical protein
MKYKQIYLSILLGVGFTVLHAQETIPAAGGEATGITGTSSYSVGQSMYTTSTGVNGSVSDGIQNNYKMIVLPIKDVITSIDFALYPNPTKNYLNLRINDFANKELSYQVYDLLGRLILIGSVLEKISALNTTDLPDATYVLKIFSGKKLIKLIKIVKY